MCKWDWMYCSLTSLQSSVWSLCVVQQDETTQRHEEYLRQIREKAFEMSILRHSTEDHNDAPEPTPYDKNKLCIICNVLVSFSLSVFHPHLATETSCALSATFWLVFPHEFFLPTPYDENKLCIYHLQRSGLFFFMSFFSPHLTTKTSCASPVTSWLVFPLSVFLPTHDENKLCINWNVLVNFSPWVFFSPHLVKKTSFVSCGVS